MITQARLRRYRLLRRRHLQYGIRNVRRYAAEYNELGEEVWDYIACLPAREALVMRLYYVDGMSCIAIGMLMHYSEGHVRRIKRRCIRELPLE